MALIHYIRRRLSLLVKVLFVVIVVYMIKNQFIRPAVVTKLEVNVVANVSKSMNLHTGSLNIHRWDSLCGFLIDSLRGNVLFPNLPSHRSTITTLKLQNEMKDIGQRIYGFIIPPTSGFYQFSIASDDTSELWLSSNICAQNASLMCRVGGYIDGKVVLGWTRPGDFNKYPTQISQQIYMNQDDRYFIEVLHKQSAGLAHLHVMWKMPGSDIFTDIASKFLATEPLVGFCDSDVQIPKQHQVDGRRMHTPGHYKKITHSLRGGGITYLRDYHKMLPNCTWLDKKVKILRYHGVWHVHAANVYPDNGSNQLLKQCLLPRHAGQCKGTPVLPEENATGIVKKYIAETLPKNYVLKSITTVELFKRANYRYQQYFIDIKVTDKTTGKVSQIAEPVWEYSGNQTLCNPSDNRWDPAVKVYVIITVKNQGLWVRHFIDTIEYIQEETNDPNIHPIIVDFGSKDVGPNDTDTYLQQSKLKNYTVIRKDGIFYKTAAINEAAASVKDNNSILFQLDLHLDLPLNLIDTVRKHTIQGKLAFTPLLMRLACGSTPEIPMGFWEDQGFGLFAVYKSDWVRFGGMNEKDFRGKWGGEDWEMLDRVIANNIAVQTLRIPGLYHFYHTKEKLWQNAT